MEAPNPNKRLRRSSSVSDFNQNHVDLIISSFLSLPDLPSSSSALSIGCSFDRALDKLLESSGDESVLNRLSDRGFQLAPILHESTKRCARKRATIRNSNSWALPYELTIKVFSMLDTKSLIQASACWTMFKKCAMDPLCYSHIDLTTGNVSDPVVRSMILNAGKELRSLKVGCPDKCMESVLSESCLDPLSDNHGFLGHLLESLHLYNLIWLKNTFLCNALSVCSNLTDLKIVGLNTRVEPRDDIRVDPRDDPLVKVLNLLTRKCKHLFLEAAIESGRSYMPGTSFEENCPCLTSLSLIGFSLGDERAYHLIMGLPKLKYINLSRSPRIAGGFLRDVSYDCRGSPLETLILRDCCSLEERTVYRFLDSLLTYRGHFRAIRHIDVTNDRGLIKGGRRFSKPKFPLKKLKEERPCLTFCCKF